jgi:predicted dehydrogenase
MVEREQLDGIVAIQMFDRHALVVQPLYRYGLPILTEKPLAASVAVGAQLLAALEAGGSWHMVAYHKRCDPATIAAKDEIARLKQSGELGALSYVRITMPAGDWIANGFYDLINTDEPYPAGPRDVAEDWSSPYFSFVNYYIHQVNLLRYLLGEPYRVTYADPSGVLLAAQSASGVAAVIEMTPYTSTRDWHERALIAFERGFIELELPAPIAINRPGRVTFFRDPGNGATPQTIVPTLPWDHAHREQARAFLQALRGAAPPPCTAAEALEDLRIAAEYIQLKETAR